MRRAWGKGFNPEKFFGDTVGSLYKMKIILARTEVMYHLQDGSWVMGMKDLWESLEI